jgi:hypothetical protein
MRISETDLALRNHGLEHLIECLPSLAQPTARWLRQPAARPVRIPAGVLLCVGGVFGILPVLGFWMLPAGLVLLAEDVPPLTRATGWMLDWVERRRPHWFAPASTSSAAGASIVPKDRV